MRGQRYSPHPISRSMARTRRVGLSPPSESYTNPWRSTQVRHRSRRGRLTSCDAHIGFKVSEGGPKPTLRSVSSTSERSRHSSGASDSLTKRSFRFVQSTPTTDPVGTNRSTPRSWVRMRITPPWTKSRWRPEGSSSTKPSIILAAQRKLIKIKRVFILRKMLLCATAK